MDMRERYARQMRLPEIGAVGQEKLAQARVLCVGAGGLGCPALLYLAAAGLGHLGIVDFDHVEESNLQRQVLFNVSDIGQPKAQAARAHLLSLNPSLTIHIHEYALNAETAPDVFEAYDFIIDGTDNFTAKFLINDAAVKFGKPWIYGAIQGFQGHVAVFDAARGACYRCLYPHPPQEEILNCAQAGVIGAVAGMVGLTQALQIIQLIVAHESFQPLINRLWILDTRSMSTRIFSLDKDPLCVTCGKKDSEIVLHDEIGTCTGVQDITLDQLEALKHAIVLDVREQEEWDAGFIPGAKLWPLSQFLAGMLPRHLTREQEIVLYCRSGKRSQAAGKILIGTGYKKIYNLAGGYEAWRGAGPV
ncbi:MAG: HesA/MoeB/ThiF family protein [Alphaproteobacteria bacterium]|nr:HesA/MoeB/ThiF family protein [Alphaproteobacteria bacterium]